MLCTGSLRQHFTPLLWSDLSESDPIRKLFFAQPVTRFRDHFCPSGDHFSRASDQIRKPLIPYTRKSPLKTHRRTRAITAHVTPEELASIAQRANTTNRSVSDWARDLLLTAAAATPQADLRTELLLSEMASIRVSMITLMQHAVNGTKITDSDLDAVIEDSDKARFTIAAHRFREGMKTLTPVPKKGLPQ